MREVYPVVILNAARHRHFAPRCLIPARSWIHSLALPMAGHGIPALLGICFCSTLCFCEAFWYFEGVCFPLRRCTSARAGCFFA